MGSSEPRKPRDLLPNVHAKGTKMLLDAIAAAPNIHPAFKAEAAAAKARCEPVLRKAIEKTCPKCGGELEDQDPIKAEPDVGIPAFSGGSMCCDCWALIPAEPNDVLPEDRAFDERMAERPPREGFIPPGCEC